MLSIKHAWLTFRYNKKPTKKLKNSLEIEYAKLYMFIHAEKYETK